MREIFGGKQWTDRVFWMTALDLKNLKPIWHRSSYWLWAHIFKATALSSFFHPIHSTLFCVLQEHLIFFTFELPFSSFLITLHLIIPYSSTFLLFNFVYSLNYQHVRMSTNGKTNKLQANTHTRICRERLSLGVCFIFSLLFSRSLIRNSEIPWASFWRLAVHIGWHMVATYMALLRTVSLKC